MENFSLDLGDSSTCLSSMAHIPEEGNSEYYVLQENFHKVCSGQCLRSIELYAVLFFLKNEITAFNISILKYWWIMLKTS